MAASDRWSDLAVRMGSALVMVILGLSAVAAGGDVFHIFVALICGAMVWELLLMLDPARRSTALALGALIGLAVMVAIYLPRPLAAACLLIPLLFGLWQVRQHRRIYLAFGILIAVAGYGMMSVRDDFGFVWMSWLVVIVVVTDVAGYFAGRLIGGPKFWPRVSPKKTWSGTAAGWVAAGLVGAVFAKVQGTGAGLVVLSVAVSMASQAGDIAESAVKRRMGVKDSSSLIPGHGGLMDRFDGMLGASLLVLAVRIVIGLPAGVA